MESCIFVHDTFFFFEKKNVTLRSSLILFMTYIETNN